ncbi:MAG TPA: hypothetical protein VIG64_02405 [Actinomycetota bacterium]|jgi:hypothetical protein
MSSPPAERPPVDPPPPRARRPFEAWRKLALAGALILLVGSVLKAALDDFPNALNVLSLGLGWGFLAAAFGRAMVDRKARERAEAAEGKPKELS